MDCSKGGGLTFWWLAESRDSLAVTVSYNAVARQMFPILSKTAGARGETEVSTPGFQQRLNRMACIDG
jgi:hypothetical protein